MATYRVFGHVTVSCEATVEASSEIEAIRKARSFAETVTTMRPEAWGDEPAFFVDGDDMDGEVTGFRAELDEPPPGPGPAPKARRRKGGDS
jgi:hypothetical protein